MSSSEEVFDDWSRRRGLTLDLIGLTDAERQDGSILLGGSSARFVTPEDDFSFQEVGDVAFLWGDPTVENTIAQLQEHDTRPESIRDQLFPFSATTLIGDQLWSLAVQRGTFDPTTAYERPDHFIEIPYRAQAGYDVLKSAFATGNFPLPQLIGRVGISWVLFEMGMTLASRIGREVIDLSQGESAEREEVTDVPIHEALEKVQNLIQEHDFERSTPEQNYAFATQLSHWVLETFALPDDDSQFFMYTHPDKEGAKGEELPIALQQLVLQQYMGETFFSDENEFTMSTDHHVFKIQEGALPLETEGMTMAETVQYLTDNPDAAAAIVPTLYAYTPRVKLTVQPKSYHGWEMQYKISRAGIEVRPVHIEDDGGISTDAAYDYAMTARNNPAELSRTVCELAVLAATYAPHFVSGTVPAIRLTELARRLEDDTPIAVIKGREHSGVADERLIEFPIREA